MQIKPLELTILVDDIEDVEINESNIIASILTGNADTRKHTFFEIDSIGEYIEGDMDLSIIYSNGVEFTCQDTYKELKSKIIIKP